MSKQHTSIIVTLAIAVLAGISTLWYGAKAPKPPSDPGVEGAIVAHPRQQPNTADSDSSADSGSAPPRIAATTRVSVESLYGTVASHLGRPIENARVCATRLATTVPTSFEEYSRFFAEAMIWKNELGGFTPICVTTDSAGHYEMRLKAGAYSVAAAAADHLPVGTRPEELISVEDTVRRDWVLDFGGATISGRVVDESRRAIHGADLLVLGAQDRSPFMLSMTTDVQGNFTLNVAEGTVMMHVSAAGFVTKSQSIAAPQYNIEITLPAAGQILGRILTSTGTPLANASVIADQKKPQSRLEFASTRSNDSGAFTIDRLPVGEYELWVRAPGWFGRYPQRILVSSELSSPNVTVQLRPANSLSARVISGADNRPCADASVILRASERGRYGPVRQLTNAQGFVTFHGLPPDNYQAVVDCFGHPVGVFTGLHIERDVQDLVWTLPKGAQLTGRVLDADGLPLADQPVLAIPAAANQVEAAASLPVHSISNDRGEFSIRGLLPQRYQITCGLDKLSNFEFKPGADKPNRVTVNMALGDVPAVTLVCAVAADIAGTLPAQVISEAAHDDA